MQLDGVCVIYPVNYCRHLRCGILKLLEENDDLLID